MVKNANGDGHSLSLVVSPKGGVQLNGLRRFPVTLYADEWEAILSRADAIRSFIKANAKTLRTKKDAVQDRGGTAI